MTLFCCCGKIQNDLILLRQMNPTKSIGNNAVDPILPLWMNQAKTIWKNYLKLQMALFCRCGRNQAKTLQWNPRKMQKDPILESS